MTVAEGATAKRLTLVFPYYENPQFLQRQYDDWQAWPSDLRAAVAIIVVDDGSPISPASDVVATWPDTHGIRLFRIDEDRRWNWLAARNIGAHHAQDGWVLLTDMDHVVPAATLQRVVYGQHDPAVAYAFSRREHTGETIGPHSASFLLTRDLFWAVGGYDETLSGYYGTDGDWRRRLSASARIDILTDPLVRHEYVGDSSTTGYQRKQPEDAAVSRLIRLRRPGWRPKALSFPYREVAC